MSRVYLSCVLCLFLVVGCREIPQPSGGWHEVESPTDKDLYSVFALSQDNAWAVGDSGVIIHWDGETWSLVESQVWPGKTANGVEFDLEEILKISA